jgi:hypothetical protein
MSDYRPEGHIFTFVNLRPDKPKTMHQLSQLHISAVQLLEDGLQCSDLVAKCSISANACLRHSCPRISAAK